tara:strand:- start:84 stop:290 length:207 start_codon:yes stop_codon:yes gene_type:complete
MNIEINNKKYDFDMEKFQKMVLLYNALEDGWKIKKINNNYIFKKKHENNDQYFNDNYINEFLKKYLQD